MLSPAREPECTDCPLSATTAHVCHPIQWYNYTPDAPLLYVLGTAPGVTENTRGLPMVGDTGRWLREEIFTELPPVSICYTTAARCYTAAKDKPATSFTKCTRHTRRELAALHTIPAPSYSILALGTPPTTQLARIFSTKNIRSTQGQEIDGWRLYSTFSPAYFFTEKGAASFGAFMDHIALLSSHLRGETTSPTSPDIHPLVNAPWRVHSSQGVHSSATQSPPERKAHP